MGPLFCHFLIFMGDRKGSLYTQHPGTEKTAESLRCFYDRLLWPMSARSDLEQIFPYPFFSGKTSIEPNQAVSWILRWRDSHEHPAWDPPWLYCSGLKPCHPGSEHPGFQKNKCSPPKYDKLGFDTCPYGIIWLIGKSWAQLGKELQQQFIQGSWWKDSLVADKLAPMWRKSPWWILMGTVSKLRWLLSHIFVWLLIVVNHVF